MIRFEDLLEKVRGYSPEADLELLRRAYVFSALEHKGQVRHSGRALPRPSARGRQHPRRHEAGRRLRRRRPAPRRRRGHADHHRADPRARSAPTSRTSSKASPRSARSRSRPAKSGRRELPQDAAGDGRRHPRHPRQARRPPAQHADAAVTCRRSGASASAQETLDIYAPIANRLGMSKVKNELEELSFKYLEPQRVRVAARRGSRRKRQVTEGEIDELNERDRRQAATKRRCRSSASTAGSSACTASG